MSLLSKPLQTAVLLLVFRRVDTTALVLDALRQARPLRLYVAADGFVPGDAPMERACQATRDLVEASVDWPCQLKLRYANGNRGCRAGVSEALDWFFTEEPEGIVLEDDIVPNPSFFGFCEELLERYRHDNRIGAITGLSLLPGQPRDPGDYRFSIYNHCWGWASWRRAWRLYDADLKTWPEFRQQDRLKQIGGRSFSRYFGGHLEQVRLGRCDTWDYIWSYSLWRHGMLTCVPAVNLVRNIGLAHPDATHTHHRSVPWDGRLYGPAEAGDLVFPLNHPAVILADQQWDREIFRCHHHPVLWKRLISRFLRFICG